MNKQVQKVNSAKGTSKDDPAITSKATSLKSFYSSGSTVASVNIIPQGTARQKWQEGYLIHRGTKDKTVLARMISAMCYWCRNIYVRSWFVLGGTFIARMDGPDGNSHSSRSKSRCIGPREVLLLDKYTSIVIDRHPHVVSKMTSGKIRVRISNLKAHIELLLDDHSYTVLNQSISYDNMLNVTKDNNNNQYHSLFAEKNIHAGHDAARVNNNTIGQLSVSQDLLVTQVNGIDGNTWCQQLRQRLACSPWLRLHRFDGFAPVRHLFCPINHMKTYGKSEHYSTGHNDRAHHTTTNAVNPFLNQPVEFFVDAAEYFEAVADAMESARQEIFIHGWWVSPELHLKRGIHTMQTQGNPSKKQTNLSQNPISLSQNYWRLDSLLLRKARQGVRVHVVVYKEVTLAFSINSQHTKTVLERLHPNITVQRHPDHNLLFAAAAGSTQSATIWWAHHEKIVVVDQNVAFIGGIDLCYGRYDTPGHKLHDSAKVNSTSNHSCKTNNCEAERDDYAGDGVNNGLSDGVNNDFNDTVTNTVTNTTGPTASDEMLLDSSQRQCMSPLNISATLQPTEKQPKQHKQDNITEAEHDREVWFGIDYYNPMVRDFVNIARHTECLIDRESLPRLPWHDLQCCLRGQLARDVSRHFVLRWNHIKVTKASGSGSKIPLLLPADDLLSFEDKGNFVALTDVSVFSLS